MLKFSTPPTPETLTPLLFSPGITDKVPDDFVQHFTYLKTGEPGQINYNLLRDTLAEQGFDLILFQPDWSNTPPEQWKEDMIAAARWIAAPGEPLVVGGFSFGALLAAQTAEVLTATRDAPRILGVVAMSHTCLFGDFLLPTLNTYPEDKDSLLASGPDGRPKLHPSTFEHLPNMRLPQLENCPAQIYVGTKEIDFMQKVANLAHTSWPGSQLIPVEGGGHDIAQPRDLAAIRIHIGKLLDPLAV